MTTKISYEWCLEELEEYVEGTKEFEEVCYDVAEPNHGELKDLNWLLDWMEDGPFYFGIKKWFYDTEIEDQDWEHIYLREDGKFYLDGSSYEYQDLPKYVMKLFEPHRDKILNHKNFRG